MGYAVKHTQRMRKSTVLSLMAILTLLLKRCGTKSSIYEITINMNFVHIQYHHMPAHYDGENTPRFIQALSRHLKHAPIVTDEDTLIV